MGAKGNYPEKHFDGDVSCLFKILMQKYKEATRKKGKYI